MRSFPCFLGVALVGCSFLSACSSEDVAPLPAHVGPSASANANSNANSNAATNGTDDGNLPTSRSGTNPTDGTSSSVPDSPDAGGASTADAGSPTSKPADAGVSVNAFTDEGAFSPPAQALPIISKGAHDKVTGRADGDPAGAACLTTGCHGGGGGGPLFLLGGTVYNGTVPAPNVEVRVRDAQGKAAVAFSNAQGNFYLRQAAATLAGVTEIGARTATSTDLMVTTLAAATEGNCNACHTGAVGKLARVFVK